LPSGGTGLPSGGTGLPDMKTCRRGMVLKSTNRVASRFPEAPPQGPSVRTWTAPWGV
jgi:hypothetical protein